MPKVLPKTEIPYVSFLDQSSEQLLSISSIITKFANLGAMFLEFMNLKLVWKPCSYNKHQPCDPFFHTTNISWKCILLFRPLSFPWFPLESYTLALVIERAFDIEAFLVVIIILTEQLVQKLDSNWKYYPRMSIVN